MFSNETGLGYLRRAFDRAVIKNTRDPRSRIIGLFCAGIVDGITRSSTMQFHAAHRVRAQYYDRCVRFITTTSLFRNGAGEFFAHDIADNDITAPRWCGRARNEIINNSVTILLSALVID